MDKADTAAGLLAGDNLYPGAEQTSSILRKTVSDFIKEVRFHVPLSMLRLVVLVLS